MQTSRLPSPPPSACRSHQRHHHPQVPHFNPRLTATPAQPYNNPRQPFYILSVRLPRYISRSGYYPPAWSQLSRIPNTCIAVVEHHPPNLSTAGAPAALHINYPRPSPYARISQLRIHALCPKPAASVPLHPRYVVSAPAAAAAGIVDTQPAPTAGPRSPL